MTRGFTDSASWAGCCAPAIATPKIRGINKTDGLTWKVKEILERVQENVGAGMRKL